MSVVRAFHEWGAWVLIAANAVAGMWALIADRAPVFRVKALWWCTAVAEVIVFIEAILGTIALRSVKGTSWRFHMLYGFSTIVAVGVLYSYRSQLKHRIFLLYGLGGMFIMGLGIRAVVLRR